MIYYDFDGLIIRDMKSSDCEKFYTAVKAQGWDKPLKQFKIYFNDQKNGKRHVFVAEAGGKVAGYATLIPTAHSGPFAGKDIPEICDFNVLIKYQGHGIGSKIMDTIEEFAAKTHKTVSLGVGLHYDYGPAQRLYVKRGYIPDGSGVWYMDKNLEIDADCKNDDELILYLSKSLK